MKDRKVKQVLSGDWYHWEGGVHKEKVKEGEIVEILCTYV
jgi:hypothetical protein